MSEESLDPRKQTLVAALYGELSEDEERAFEGMLETDPELRAEWEELQGTRAFLREWAPEETAPGFVFLDPAGASGPSRGPRFLRRLGELMSPPAWGFAAATAALLALVLGGLRVDRVESGLAFRFGPSPEVAAPSRMPESSPPGDLASGPDAVSTPATEGAHVIPVAGEVDVITRDELDAHMALLMRAFDARLSDYQQRQNGELGYLLQSFYREIRDRQMRDFGMLRDQIEGVELGMYKQSRRSSLPDSLFHRPESRADNPSDTTDDPREDDQE